jgi:hypothetical protein
MNTGDELSAELELAKAPAETQQPSDQAANNVDPQAKQNDGEAQPEADKTARPQK